MSVLIAIFGLALLVMIHEAGHFFAARAVGMTPRKFYLGFGPPIVRKRHGGVEYGIGSIPLGGYVKITGMNPHEEIPPHDKKSYANASWHARFLTIVAGPLANYLLAVVAFFFVRS